MTVAVVTGSARGIGRSIALRLAQEGWTVIVTDQREEGVKDTVRAIADAGGAADFVIGDLRDVSFAEEIRAKAEESGDLGLLINNAAIADNPPTLFGDADASRWWDVVEVNLRGTMLMTHSLLPLMTQGAGGRIINIVSLLGAWGVPKMSAYSVSKAAIMRLTSVLSDELHESGIRIFDLSPGTVKTDLSDQTLSKISGGPVTAFASPELTAAQVVALASGRYDALSGRVLRAADDLDVVLRTVEGDGRTRQLRLVPTGPDDLP